MLPRGTFKAKKMKMLSTVRGITVMMEPGRCQDCPVPGAGPAVYSITPTFAAMFWDNLQNCWQRPPRGTAREAGFTLRLSEPGAASGTQPGPDTGWANPSCLLPPLRAPLCPFSLNAPD